MADSEMQDQQVQQVASLNINQALSAPGLRSKSKRYASSRDWLSSCRSIQQERMTPEMKARLQRQAKRQRNIGKKCKRARVYAKANDISRKAWAQGNMRLMSAPAPQVDSSRSEYYGKASRQMRSIQAVYHNASAWSADNDEEEDALEEQLDMIDAEQLVDGTDNANLSIAANDDMTIHQILRQLMHEPTDDEEIGRKFELYTSLLETVEASRKATNDFWADCKEDFEAAQGNVVAQVERDIKNIDSEDNLGIADHGHRWFVYDMTAKADQNNTMIKGVLKKIETKLELLNKNDDDCPFCLEPLAEIGDPVVLGCCHKACKECWENWQEIKGRNAFCPLCRQDDFLADIVNMR